MASDCGHLPFSTLMAMLAAIHRHTILLVDPPHLSSHIDRPVYHTQSLGKHGGPRPPCTLHLSCAVGGLSPRYLRPRLQELISDFFSALDLPSGYYQQWKNFPYEPLQLCKKILSDSEDGRGPCARTKDQGGGRLAPCCVWRIPMRGTADPGRARSRLLGSHPRRSATYRSGPSIKQSELHPYPHFDCDEGLLTRGSSANLRHGQHRTGGGRTRGSQPIFPCHCGGCDRRGGKGEDARVARGIVSLGRHACRPGRCGDEPVRPSAHACKPSPRLSHRSPRRTTATCPSPCATMRFCGRSHVRRGGC